MAKIPKKEAVKIITQCAQQYQEHLENKTILLFCQDKVIQYNYCLELHFYDRNFLHLTGVKLREHFYNNSQSDSPAVFFYKKCLNHKLGLGDFDYAEDGTTILKLEVLPRLISPNLSAKMVGNSLSDRPKLFTEKLAGGTTGCLGFVVDSSLNVFVPNTSLNEDIRKCVKSSDRVLAVFRKNKDEEKYSEITYLAKKINWSQIKFPREYKYLGELIQNNKK